MLITSTLPSSELYIKGSEELPFGVKEPSIITGNKEDSLALVVSSTTPPTPGFLGTLFILSPCRTNHVLLSVSLKYKLECADCTLESGMLSIALGAYML